MTLLSGNQRVWLIVLAFTMIGAAAAREPPTRRLSPEIVLAGLETASTCPVRATDDCLSARDIEDAYMARRESPDTELNIFIHGSPWTLIGPDERFVSPEELAAQITSRDEWRKLAPFRTIRLLSSWSSVRIDAGRPSLAERFALALGVSQVEGAAGFLWLRQDGTTRVSRHAATVMRFPFLLQRGDELMLSAELALQPEFFEQVAVDRGRAEAYFRAGVSAEVFGLDRELALTKFRAAAADGHTIGAYNAASILMDRNRVGDRDDALQLLRSAASSGDEPSGQKLRTLSSASQERARTMTA